MSNERRAGSSSDPSTDWLLLDCIGRHDDSGFTSGELFPCSMTLGWADGMAMESRPSTDAPEHAQNTPLFRCFHPPSTLPLTSAAAILGHIPWISQPRYLSGPIVTGRPRLCW